MHTKQLIKPTITLGMIALVAYSVSFEKLIQTLREIELSTVVIVVLGYGVGQLISSVKWWLIARSGGIDVSYSSALKAYFIGMFVNCFGLGLGTVGGDVARGVLLSKGLPKKTEGIASVVADRIHGLGILSLVALLGSLIFQTGRVPSALIIALVGIVVCIMGVWFFTPQVIKLIPDSVGIKNKLQQAAKLFPRDKGTLLLISAISLIFHLIQVSLHAVMAYGIGATLPFTILFVIIPMVNIASSLPISWNGLGVRENSYMFFLSSATAILTPEQATAFGAIWLLAVTFTSLIGGFVAILSGDLKFLKRTAMAPAT